LKTTDFNNKVFEFMEVHFVIISVLIAFPIELQMKMRMKMTQVRKENLRKNRKLST